MTAAPGHAPQPDPRKAAPHGFFFNVTAVLLRLCAPFMDPSGPLFWQRVDASFVATGGATGGERERERERESAWGIKCRGSACMHALGGAGREVRACAALPTCILASWGGRAAAACADPWVLLIVIGPLCG